ncbi:hypothetical protein K1719_000465 [Acacia pycnantha]|nr:hypothetical protein K1719_000465 [Acacia pycnantha]
MTSSTCQRSRRSLVGEGRKLREERRRSSSEEVAKLWDICYHLPTVRRIVFVNEALNIASGSGGPRTEDRG